VQPALRVPADDIGEGAAAVDPEIPFGGHGSSPGHFIDSNVLIRHGLVLIRHGFAGNAKADDVTYGNATL
jgi:hypothetical protein